MSKRGVLWGLGGILGVVLATTLCLLFVAVMGTGAQNSTQGSVEPQVTTLPTGEASDYEIAESPEVEQRVPSSQPLFQPNDRPSVPLGTLPSESPSQTSFVAGAEGEATGEAAMATISLDPVAPIPEGNTGLVTARLNGELDFPLVVTLVTSAVASANYQTDYEISTPAIMTIPAGSLATTFEIQTTPDTLYEGTEMFELVLQVPPGTMVRTVSVTRVVTIMDDDPLPTVSLDPIDPVLEGRSRLITASLNRVAGAAVRVSLARGDASTAAEDDYRLPQLSILLTAGERTVIFKLTANEDALYELTETLVLQPSVSHGGDTLIGMAQAVMIIEDDPPPSASVPKYFVDTFMGSNFQDISSEQGVHTFPANRRDNPNIGYSRDLGFDFEFYGETHDTVAVHTNGFVGFTTNPADTGRGINSTLPRVIGGATPGDVPIVAPFLDDLDPRPDESNFYAITLGAGTSEHRFIAQYSNYRVVERNRRVTFQVVLYAVDGKIEFRYHSVPGEGETAKVGISDGSNTPGNYIEYSRRQPVLKDDTRIVFTPVTLLAEGGDSPEITLFLSSALDTTATVELRAASAGTAEYPADYVLSQDSVQIPAGAVTATIPLQIIDDDTYERIETGMLNLRVLRDGTVLSESSLGFKIVDNDLPPTISLDPVAPITEGDTGLVTARLSHGQGFPLVVTLVTSAVASANYLTDYEISVPTMMTIPTGSLTAIFEIQVTDDGIDEGPETFELVLQVPPSTMVRTVSVPRVVTILDRRARVSLLEIPPVMEGMARMVTATLDIASGSAIAVELIPSHTDADLADYSTPTTLRAIIPPGELTVAFTISAAADGIYEGTEILEFTLSIVSGEANVAEPRIRQLSIIDAEPVPSISFVEASSTIAEGARHDIELRLSGVSEDDITVTFETAGSATRGANADYTLAATTVTFPAESTSNAIIRLNVNNDKLYEGLENETIVLSLVSATGGVTVDGTKSKHTVTIIDNDVAPDPIVIGFDSGTYRVNEASGTVELTVEVIDGVRTEAVTLTYTTTDGGATSPDDYTGGSFPLTLPAMATSVTFTIPIVDDSVVEQAEAFTVVLSSDSAGVSFNPTVATVRIIDNDIVLGFEPAVYTVDEDSGTVELTVEVIDGVLTEDVTLTYTTTDGGATSPDDYTGGSFPLTLPAMARSVTFTIPIVDDSVVEPAEAFTVVLSSDSAGVSFNPTVATVRIIDNDVVTATLLLETLELSEGQTGTLEIQLTANAPEDLTFTLELDGVPGDVTDSDYTLTPIVVLIPAGANRGTVSIFAVDDSDPEEVESFTLRLESVSTRVAIGTTGAITVTIPANDEVEAVVIGFDTATYRVNEGSGTVELTVSVLSGVLTETLRLSYAVSDVSTTVSDDYTVSGDTLELSLLTSSVTITVDIIDDTSDEPEEAFTVELSGAPADITLDPATAIVTIIDDDPTPTATLSTASLKVEEGQDASFMIRLLGMSAEDLEFTLTRVSGTASEGDDYSLSATQIEIEAGMLAAVVTITVLSDTIYELTETVQFELTLTSGANVNLGDPSELSLEIIEQFSERGDVYESIVAFENQLETCNSELDTCVVTDSGTHSEPLGLVLRDASSTRDTLQALPAGYQYIAGSALADIYFVDGDGNTVSNLNGAVTITTTVSQSQVDSLGGPERISFAVLHEGETVWELPATTSVYDTDAGKYTFATTSSRFSIFALVSSPELVPTLSFEGLDAVIREGRGDEFTVNLSAPLEIPLTISFSSSLTSTARAGDDYVLPDPVTIPASQTSVQLRLNTVQNTIYGGDKQLVLIAIGRGDGVDPLVTEAVEYVVTIEEDEVPVLSITGDLADRVDEGRIADVSVELNFVLEFTITVSLVPAAGTTAQLGEDYEFVNGESSIEILPGDTFADFSLRVLQDEIYEGDEQFVLILQSDSDEIALENSRREIEITITESLSKPTVSLISDGMVTEGNDLTVTVRLNGAVLDKTVTVELLATNDSAESDDYTISPASVTIAPGLREAKFTLNASNDPIFEANEILTLEPVATLTGSVSLDPDANSVPHQVVIVESLLVPSLSLISSDPDLEFNEGQQGIQITARLSDRAAFTVTVSLSLGDGSTVESADLSLDTDTIEITPGLTDGMFTLNINQDTIYEDDEQLILEARVTGGGIEFPVARLEADIIEDDSLPTLSLGSTPAEIDEGQGVTITVRLSGALDEDLSVSVRADDLSTAVNPDDYTITPLTFVISPLSLTATFRLNTERVMVFEDDKTVSLVFSTDNAQIVLDETLSTPVSIVIRELDLMPVLTLDPILDVSEGETLTVTARLSSPLSVGLTLTLVTAGDALDNIDYVRNFEASSLRIPAGDLTATFTFNIVVDELFEGNETVILTLGVVSPPDGLQLNNVVREFNILDAGLRPNLSLLPIDDINEGEATIVTARLNRPLATALQVIFTADTSDTETEDYLPGFPLTAEIATGSLEVSFILTATIDDIYDRDETLVLSLTADTDTVNLGTVQQSLQIIDTNERPTLVFANTESSIPETATEQFALLVEFTGKIEDDVNISLEVLYPRSTAEPSDVRKIEPGSRGFLHHTEFNKGKQYVEINGRIRSIASVTVSDDQFDIGGPRYEGDEVLVLQLTARFIGEDEPLVQGIFHLTIEDNEAPPTLELELSDQMVSEGYTQSLVGTVSLGDSDALLEEPLTVYLERGPDTTAEVTDYWLSTATVTIPAGSRTSEQFTLRIVQDEVYEGDEVLELVARASVAGVQLPTLPNVGTQGTVLTIEEDEPQPLLTLDPIPNIEEGAEGVTVTIRLSGALQDTVTVVLAVALSDGTAGNAIEADYSLAAIDAVVEPGQQVATFRLEASEDQIYEGNEQLVLVPSVMNVGTDGVSLTAAADVQVTIIDGEERPTLSLDPIEDVEEGNSVTVTVRLSGALAVPLTIPLTVEPGSAPDSADVDDYAALPQDVTILAGTTTVVFTLLTNDDSIYEGDERLTLRLETATLTVGFGTVEQELTIIENDEAPVPVVEIGFDPVTYSVGEASGTVELTVEVINGTLTDEVVLSYTTMDDSATSPGDYTSVASTLTLSAMTPSVTFNVAIFDDVAQELNETFTVTLDGAPAGVVLILSTATVTIIDDDEAPVVPEPPEVVVVTATLSTDRLAVEEGQDASFVVRLSEVSEEDLEFTLTRVSGTASEGDDYSLSATRIEIEAGMLVAVVTITVLSDTIYELTETVQFELTLTSGANVNLGDPSELSLEIIEQFSERGDVYESIVAFENQVETCNSELDTCVVTDSATHSEPLGLVLQDASATRDTLQELPAGYQYVAGSALADIYFVNDAGDIVSNLNGAVTITTTVSQSQVDSLGGPERISFAVLHDGETVWELPATTSVYDADAEKYTFATTSSRFSIFALVSSPDDAGPVPTLSLRLARIGESEHEDYLFEGQSLSINAYLTSPLGQNLSLVLKTPFAGTATSGDYSTTPTGVPFRIPGNGDRAEGSFKISARSDAVTEEPESIVISIEVAESSRHLVEQGLIKIGTLTRTLYILDNDAPKPTLSLEPIADLDEGGSRIITASLSFALPFDLEVTIGVDLASSTAELDSYLLSPLVSTIPAGAREVRFALETTDDMVHYRSDETPVLGIELSADTQIVGLGETRRSVIIRENDPTPALRLGEIGQTVDEGDSLTFTVEVVGSASYTQTLTLIPNFGDFNTDRAGVDDLSFSPTSVTIPADRDGSSPISQFEFTISTNPDNIYEDTELIKFELVLEDDTGVQLDQFNSIIELIDDEPIPTLSLGPIEDVTEGGVFTVTVRLSSPIEVRLPITELRYVPVGSTAEMADYVVPEKLSRGEIRIAAGMTTTVIAFQTRQDEVYEGVETLVLRPYALGGGLDLVGISGEITIIDDEPIPTVSLESPGQVDEGDSIIVTVRLDGVLESTVTVELVPINGNTESDDYTISPTSVTILPGDREAEFTLTAHSDIIPTFETTETLTLNPVAIIVEGLVGLDTDSSVPHRVAISEILPIPSLSLISSDLDLEFDEGQQNIQITARLSDIAGFTVTVSLGLGDGSTVELADFALDTDTIEIGPGLTDGVFTLNINQDTIYEDDEQLILEARVTGGGIEFPVARLEADIIEDEPQPLLTLDPVPNIVEGESVTVTVRLSGALAVPLTIPLTVVLDGTPDSAEVGDYATLLQDVTISAGATTTVFTLLTNDDSVYEGDERLTLRLETATLTVGFGTVEQELTIIDNDVEIGFRPDAYRVNEASGTVQFTVEVINGILTDEVVLNYETMDDSATSPGDYTSVASTLTLSAMTPSVTFNVAIIDGVAEELTETFTVALSALDMLSAGVVLTSDVATVTITDDDEAPVMPEPPKVVVVTATLSTAGLKVEEGQDASFMILLLETATEDLEFELTRIEEGSTATEGDDYSLPALPIVVPAGELGVSVTISTLSDVAYEVDKTVRFALTPVSGSNVNLGTPSEILLEIEELFDAVLTFETDSVEVRDEDLDTSVITEAGTYSETLRVVLRDASPMREVLQELPAEYQHLEVSSLADIYFVDDGGDTVSELDREVTVMISVPMSEVDNPERISFAVLHDGESEWDLLATTYKVVDSEYVFETASDRFSLFGLVLRNDPRPEVEVVTATLSLENLTVPEDDARTFEIRLSGNAPEDLTFTLVGGPSGEYSLSPDPIVISRDSDSVIVTVTALEDVDAESDEVFTLSLMSESSLVVIGDPGSITVTIPENDQPATPVLPSIVTATLSLENLTVPEDDARTFEIRLSRNAPEDLTFTLVGGPSGEYSLSPDPIVISRDSDSVIVTVTAVEDVDAESDEVFTLSLMSESSLVVIGDPGSITVTIPENDQPATPVLPSIVTATLSLENLTVPEDDARTFEIRLSENAPEDLTFTLVGGPSGEYSLSPDPIVVSKGVTSVIVTVTALEDVDAESDEVFTLSLMSESSLVVIGDPGSVTVTIPENDQPTTPVLPSVVTATLSLENLTVPEDDARTFEIRLSENAPEDLTFTLVGGPVGEYSLSPDPIVISKGVTSVIVTVTAVEDVDAESDEVFTLSLMSESSWW